jgi:hypothetical protein
VHLTRRRVLGALALLLLATLAAGAWLAYRGLAARTELTAARAALSRLTAAAGTGDVAGATAPLAELRVHTGRARRLTHDPVWALAARVPTAGNSIATLRGVTDGLDRLAGGVLPPLVQVADTVTPARLRSGPATVDVAALAAAAPPVAQALAELQAVNATVLSTPETGLIRPVAAGRQEVVAQLGRLTATLGNVDLAARVLPAALGARGTTRWFVALQTPAEARGTGGLLGAFAIVRVRDGTVAMERVDTNGGLPDVGAVTPPAVPAGFLERWDAWSPNELWINAGVSPHFPVAAEIWAAQWRRAGEPVQGVLTLDPFVLGYLLETLGPVTADGRRIDAGNAATFVLQDAYRLYPDNDEREAVLRQIMRGTFRKFFAGGGDARGLVEALARGVREGRVQAAMPGSPQQRILQSVRIGGALPAGPAPFLGVYLNDAGGSKLDTYTTRTIEYRSGACTGARRVATVTVQLGNSAPGSGLPAYVVSRADRPERPYPRGQRRAYLSLYTTAGTRLLSAEIDGKPAALEAAVELGHPVFSSYLLVDPGKVRTLTARLSEPATAGALELRYQPLVRSPTVTNRSLPCATG